VIFDINNNQADLTILLNHPAIAGAAANLGTVCDLDVIIWPRKGLQMSSTADLRGKKLLFIHGAVYEDKLPMEGVVRMETSTSASQVKMLQAGRVDAVAGVRDALMFAAAKQGIAAEEFGQPYAFATMPTYLFVSSQFHANEAATAALAGALKQIRMGEAIPRIFAHYLPRGHSASKP
jgi:ABC-type amino acid transport substrate-binding protein